MLPGKNNRSRGSVTSSWSLPPWVALAGVTCFLWSGVGGAAPPPTPAPLSPTPAAPAPALEAVAIKVENPLGAARTGETVVVALAELRRIAPSLEPDKMVVVDAAGKPVDSQLVDMNGDEAPDDLVFQSDFRASETRTFVARAGARRVPGIRDFKVYGRFVRERHDDFAWENDRIAHRMYGPDLETWKAEPLTSSGIDVWCKRARRLLINDWYLTDDYHRDNGEGGDFYSVGKSRGCGGVGIWAGDRLAVSHNFTSSRVLANGPIRLVFELRYAPFDAGGVRVAETKRVTLDAGKSFDRFESTFTVEGQADPHAPLSVGIGIAKHAGGVSAVDEKAGWLRTWEPLQAKGKVDAGALGCAVVVGPGGISAVKDTASDFLVIARAQPNVPLVYHAGFGWDRGGGPSDADGWARQVAQFAREVGAPLRISLQRTQVASAAAVSPASWTVRACDAVMRRSPVLTERWTYDAGLVLQGFVAAFRETGDVRYIDYVKDTVDRLLGPDGAIRGYHSDDFVLDDVNMGKVLFPLLARASSPEDKARYTKVLLALRAQLREQPRTADGGFWHKGIYRHQMWLDGVFMASPFLAELGATLGDPSAIDDAAAQVLLAEKHLRDPATGLLYHGWDESRTERWADPQTGRSSQFWARGVGWYAMGVVDVLEVLPRNHPKRAAVLALLRRLADGIASVQDKRTGVWWQVLDAADRPQNYPEASASSMFAYAIAKGVRNGWLDERKFGPVAKRAYQGLLDRFVEASPDGDVTLNSVCKVAGLGGKPYRDGSYAYYTSTEVVANDPKGVGAFILASAEHERAARPTRGRAPAAHASR